MRVNRLESVDVFVVIVVVAVTVVVATVIDDNDDGIDALSFGIQ